MNMQELKQLIYKGEKVDIECKEAESNVPRSAYESYSAFANTKGGYIILGVKEDKKKILPEEIFIIKCARFMLARIHTKEHSSEITKVIITQRNMKSEE